MEASRLRCIEDHVEALHQLLEGCFDGVEQLPLASCLNRRLAADIHAPVSLPLFRNSQMDGYAVASSETRILHTFDVAEPVPAGHASQDHQAGTAVPVMTGAMLPSGADAVVPIELADPHHFVPVGTRATVQLPPDIPAGQFVRPQGSDIREGELALRSGQVLGPAQLGLAAALGIASIAVRRRPRILLLSTGDEVVPPGSFRAVGQIYDANTTIIGASLEESGADVLFREISADSVPSFLATLDSVVAEAGIDLIITTGGISAGAYEVVRQALDARGVAFIAVNMQPGGPQAIGRYAGVPFVGFPGNPVSAWVSFEVLLRPVLCDLGVATHARHRHTAVLTEPLNSPRGKHQFRRALLVGARVRPLGGPGSHLLRSMSDANALIHIPPQVERMAAGESVDVVLTGAEHRGDIGE